MRRGGRARSAFAKTLPPASDHRERGAPCNRGRCGEPRGRRAHRGEAKRIARMTSGAFVVYAGRVVTCDPARAAMGNPLGALADAGVLVERGTIRLGGGLRDV